MADNREMITDQPRTGTRELRIITDEFQISPQGSRAQSYFIRLSTTKLSIYRDHRGVECELADSGEVTWSLHPGGEARPQVDGCPLLEMFADDNIWPPDVVTGALEWLLETWSSGGHSKRRVKAELRELFAWINHIAQTAPKGDFWRDYFNPGSFTDS